MENIPNEEVMNEILGSSDEEENDVPEDVLDSPGPESVEEKDVLNLTAEIVKTDNNEDEVNTETHSDRIDEADKNDETGASTENSGNLETCNDKIELDLSILDEKDEIVGSTPVSASMDYSSLTFDELMKLMDDISDVYEAVDDNEDGAKKKPPIDWKKIKKKLIQIEPHYTDVLKKVYSMYCKPVPSKIPQFRSFFKDRNNRLPRNLIGVESLQEYVDNNHPLWAEDREVCLEYLESRVNGTTPRQHLADYIHSKWGNQQIDISKNNSFITRSTILPKSSNTRRKSLLNYSNAEDFDYQRKMLSKFCEMDIEQVKKEVLEKEEERLICHLSKDDAPNVNNNNVNPRKRGFEQREEAFTEDEVKKLIKYKGENEGWTVKRTAEAIIGVEEVFMMKSHYPNPKETVPSIPRSHLEEIIAMEEAHGKILDFYKDPTEKDNDDENEDWIDIVEEL